MTDTCPDLLDEIVSTAIARPVLYQRWEDDGLDECTDERSLRRQSLAEHLDEVYCMVPSHEQRTEDIEGGRIMSHARPDDSEWIIGDREQAVEDGYSLRHQRPDDAEFD